MKKLIYLALFVLIASNSFAAYDCTPYIGKSSNSACPNLRYIDADYVRPFKDHFETRGRSYPSAVVCSETSMFSVYLGLDVGTIGPRRSDTYAGTPRDFSPEVYVPDFGEPVDIYLGIIGEVLGSDALLWNQDDDLVFYSKSGLVPWRTSVSGPIYVTRLTEPLDEHVIPEGEYKMIMLVLPAGSDVNSVRGYMEVVTFVNDPSIPQRN